MLRNRAGAIVHVSAELISGQFPVGGDHWLALIIHCHLEQAPFAPSLTCSTQFASSICHLVPAPGPRNSLTPVATVSASA